MKFNYIYNLIERKLMIYSLKLGLFLMKKIINKSEITVKTIEGMGITDYLITENGKLILGTETFSKLYSTKYEVKGALYNNSFNLSPEVIREIMKQRFIKQQKIDLHKTK